MRLAALLLPIVASGIACAPKMHRVEPYQSDPAAAAELEARAQAFCEAASPAERSPRDKRFITDGCTAWFDRDWEGCCVEHDIAYWCGGSAQERKLADRELQMCVAESDDAPGWLAWMTYLGVRVGGHPVFPVHYRWGFGRSSYRPLYEEAKPAEEDGPDP